MAVLVRLVFFYVSIFCAYFSRTNVASLLAEYLFIFQRKKLGYFNYFLKFLILGDPGAVSGGDGKSKRAKIYGTKKS